ncbi:hypothetical protein OXX79_007469 [Metschnikowia pulcherrima]
MAVATAAKWMWGFLISSQLLLFSQFAYTTVLCPIFSFVRGIKGLSLEELDGLYVTDLPPWKTVGWKPPSVKKKAQVTKFAEAAKPTNRHV